MKPLPAFSEFTLGLLLLFPGLAFLPVLASTPLLAKPAQGKVPGNARQAYAGPWETSYGPMTLAQDGDRVFGSYWFNEARCTVEGRVEGGRFVFTYREPSASGEGWFALSKDGKSLTGQWREQKSDAWLPWTGRRAEAGGLSFAGLWESRYGRIRLVEEDGKRFRGCYAPSDGSSSPGKLEGSVSGTKLTFQYQEGSAQGGGWFELSPDGASFTGQWKAAGSETGHEWNGVRVAPVSGRKWLVVVEANWEQRLGEREYSFGSMLRAFFERSPSVRVRHRFFRDEADVRCWLSEVAYLAEPAVVVISSHGQADGIPASGATLGPMVFAEALHYASNVQLLHFASCLALSGTFGQDIQARLSQGASFPVSGYASSVDWGASAVLEFLYYDLILTRGLEPAEAARQLPLLAPFAGDRDLPDAPFSSAGFRFLPPSRK